MGEGGNLITKENKKKRRGGNEKRGRSCSHQLFVCCCFVCVCVCLCGAIKHPAFVGSRGWGGVFFLVFFFCNIDHTLSEDGVLYNKKSPEGE